jgi:hypothetical protein
VPLPLSPCRRAAPAPSLHRCRHAAAVAVLPLPRCCCCGTTVVAPPPPLSPPQWLLPPPLPLSPPRGRHLYRAAATAVPPCCRRLGCSGPFCAQLCCCRFCRRAAFFSAVALAAVLAVALLPSQPLRCCHTATPLYWHIATAASV